MATTASSSSQPSSSVVQSDAAPSVRPPAALLHRHALESIFAFLRLGELVFALRVSRDWLAAVGSMGRLRLGVGPASTAQRVVVADSAIGRHVCELLFNSENAYIRADTLTVLAEQMAHLSALSCRLWLPPTNGPLVFPAKLQRLTVKMPPADPDDINAAIAVIGQLPLLEDFDIFLHEMDPQISFAQLAALPLLRRLEIVRPSGEGGFSDAQVDELRALPQLQELNVRMTTPLMRRLLPQPHDLQWQQISLPYPLDDDSGALLPQLPSLTKINDYVWCERFDWLGGLPNLTSAGLWLHKEAHRAGRADSLVAGLQCCANIEKLTLNRFVDLTAAHLANLLPRLPRLRELWLENLLVDSLAFLSQPPMTRQLSKLWLTSCRRLPLAEVRHVHALCGLEDLMLSGSFDAPMDERSQSLLRPPSLLLPLLEEFSYFSFAI